MSTPVRPAVNTTEKFQVILVSGSSLLQFVLPDPVSLVALDHGCDVDLGVVSPAGREYVVLKVCWRSVCRGLEDSVGDRRSLPSP